MPLPIEKILEAAQKAGFDSELKAASILAEAGWKANQSVYFIDKDENKGRELDAAAYRVFFDGSRKPEISCIINLCIEVKKTSDPFIFYSSEPSRFEGVSGYGLFHWQRNVTHDVLSYQDIERYKPFANPKRVARSYSGFKDGKTNHIQSGVISAFKAAVHEQENCDERYSTVSRDISFFIPIMVVDGPLYECFFESGNPTLKAEEVEEILFIQNYHSVGYGRLKNGVYVVSLNRFREKVDEFTRWGEHMCETLRKKSNA